MNAAPDTPPVTPPVEEPAGAATIETVETDPLVAEVRDRERERWLATLWAPENRRAGLLAIHAYDLEQQRVVADIEDPMVAEIRLAWWREQMEALEGGAVPEHLPVLQELAAMHRAEGVDLKAFAALADGVVPILGEEPLDAAKLAAARGEAVFSAMAHFLGSPVDVARVAGRTWGLARLVRGGWGRRAARLAGIVLPAPEPVRGPLPAPLAVLARLAFTDVRRYRAGKPLRRPASAGRLWRMLFATLRA